MHHGTVCIRHTSSAILRLDGRQAVDSAVDLLDGAIKQRASDELFIGKSEIRIAKRHFMEDSNALSQRPRSALDGVSLIFTESGLAGDGQTSKSSSHGALMAEISWVTLWLPRNGGNAQRQQLALSGC